MKKENKFNWKFVITSLLIIIMAYFVISYVINLNKKNAEMETLFCHFNKVISNDSVPRDECAILKIISSNIDAINMTPFLDENKTFLPCSSSLDKIPTCEGEVYHFTKFTLRTFCEIRPCDIDGWICGAYYVTYNSNNSISRQIYEELMFTDINIESEERLMEKLRGCGS